MMRKELDSNADWIARREGRIPSKGALAAERASAGLGATDHDAELMTELLSLQALRAKRVVHRIPELGRP
jgi:hypothetical protein